MSIMKKLFLYLLLLGLSSHVVAFENPQVRMETNMGTVDIELYMKQAPQSVNNFLRYVNEDFYSDTIFHRVIKGFMIQGGGFTTNYQKKPNYDPVTNEADNGLKNDRGTIAMARTGIPHSATSQFFINTVDNDFLNFTNKSTRGWGYAVFGKVTRGLDIVDKIESTATGPGGPFPSDAPQQQVIIKSIKLLKSKTE